MDLSIKWITAIDLFPVNDDKQQKFNRKRIIVNTNLVPWSKSQIISNKYWHIPIALVASLAINDLHKMIYKIL